jgi:hypothetical protein
VPAAGGQDVAPSDPNPSDGVGHGFASSAHWPAEAASAIAAAQGCDRAVFCSSPAKDDDRPADMAREIPSGRALALIVEPPSGRTASAALCAALRTDLRRTQRIDIPRFPRMRDALHIFARR